MIFEFSPGYGPGEVADVEAFGGEFGCLCDCGGLLVFCSFCFGIVVLMLNKFI